MPVDDAWLNRDGEYARRVEARVRAEADRLKLGVEVKRVTLDTGGAVPPLQTSAAFTAVTRAEEERRRRRAEAENYATRLRNETNTAAARILADANTAYDTQTNTVQAEAENFAKLYEEYRKNPDIISQRIYEDTMQRVLARLDRKYVIEMSEGQQLRITLDPGQAKPPAAP
jgi:membrane protease subunit HflK